MSKLHLNRCFLGLTVSMQREGWQPTLLSDCAEVHSRVYYILPYVSRKVNGALICGPLRYSMHNLLHIAFAFY